MFRKLGHLELQQVSVIIPKQTKKIIVDNKDFVCLQPIVSTCPTMWLLYKGERRPYVRETENKNRTKERLFSNWVKQLEGEISHGPERLSASLTRSHVHLFHNMLCA